MTLFAYSRTRKQTALARWHAEDPKLLLYRLVRDLTTVANYEAIDEAFHDEDTRKPLPDPPTPLPEVKTTDHFASHIADGQPRTVRGGEDLTFRYADREIFPLRQTKRGGPRPARRSLDLLLVSNDGLPIVGELKIRTDRATYFAFVQALMYAVELSSPAQRKRLAKYNEDAGFEWPSDGPYMDVYLVALEPPSTAVDNNRSRSFEATKRISEELVKHDGFRSVIRRIAYIEAAADDDQLVFHKRFAFSPGMRQLTRAHINGALAAHG